MSEFCFPLRPSDPSDPSSPSTTPTKPSFHQRTFTGIELPPEFLQQQKIVNNPSSPNKSPNKSPHKRHQHRRSGAISIDLKSSAPGLVPPLAFSSPTSSIPPVPDIPSQYTINSPTSPSSYKLHPPSPNSIQSCSLSIFPSPSSSFSSPSPASDHHPSKSTPKVQFLDPIQISLSPENQLLQKPFQTSLLSSPQIHKKVKSWSGPVLSSSYSNTPPSPPLISDPPSIPPTNALSESQLVGIIDLAISAPPDSPPCYDPSSLHYYSSSYIDSSQLVVGNPTIQSSAAISSTFKLSEPVIDLDAALGPFRTPSASSLKFETSHRRSESAPESSFESINNRFHSFNKPVDDENVIIEEEEEIISPVLSPATLASPPLQLPRGNISLAENQEALASNASINSSNSGSGTISSLNNKDRDRARLQRNYNSLSLATPPPAFAMNLKNHSSSSILSDISGNPFHNSASSNNTSLSNITSVIKNENDDSFINEELSDVVNESSVTPRVAIDQHLANANSINRLSTATNDTLTPSVSNPSHVVDSHVSSNDSLIIPQGVSPTDTHLLASSTPHASPFHLKSLRNADLLEVPPVIRVSQPLKEKSSFKSLLKSSKVEGKSEGKSRFRFHKKMSSMLSPEPKPTPHTSQRAFNKSHSTHGLSSFMTDSPKPKGSIRRSSCAMPSSVSSFSIPSAVMSANAVHPDDFKKSHKKKSSRVWNWVRSRHF